MTCHLCHAPDALLIRRGVALCGPCVSDLGNLPSAAWGALLDRIRDRPAAPTPPPVDPLDAAAMDEAYRGYHRAIRKVQTANADALPHALGEVIAAATAFRAVIDPGNSTDGFDRAPLDAAGATDGRSTPEARERARARALAQPRGGPPSDSVPEIGEDCRHTSGVGMDALPIGATLSDGEAVWTITAQGLCVMRDRPGAAFPPSGIMRRHGGLRRLS